MSFKNGWFPSLLAMILVCREFGHIKWSTIAGTLVFVVALIFTGHYVWHVSHGTLDKAIYLYDDSMLNLEYAEANPFLSGLCPFLYVPFLLIPLLIPFSLDVSLVRR